MNICFIGHKIITIILLCFFKKKPYYFEIKTLCLQHLLNNTLFQVYKAFNPVLGLISGTWDATCHWVVYNAWSNKIMPSNLDT